MIHACYFALKILTETDALRDYSCELDIILLTLRSHCAAHGDNTLTLIQFVGDLLLSSVKDCHLHAATVERILRAENLISCNDSDGSLSSLDEVLSGSLEVPDPNTSGCSYKLDDCHTQELS